MLQSKIDYIWDIFIKI